MTRLARELKEAEAKKEEDRLAVISVDREAKWKAAEKDKLRKVAEELSMRVSRMRDRVLQHEERDKIRRKKEEEMWKKRMEELSEKEEEDRRRERAAGQARDGPTEDWLVFNQQVWRRTTLMSEDTVII